MKLVQAFESRLVCEAQDDGVERLVVAAVVKRKDRILLLRRRYEDFMGGLYELPSGMVEAGETLGRALSRELGEETGLHAEEISDYLGFFDYLSGSGTRTRQFNFLVSVANFSHIRLMEHDAFLWAAPGDLGRLNISEAVRNLLGHPGLEKVSPEGPP